MHELSTPMILRETENWQNPLNKISSIIEKNLDEKTKWNFTTFDFLFGHWLRIFMIFYGVVGHWDTLTVMTFKWRFLHDAFK